MRFHSYRPKCLLQVNGPDAKEFLQGQFSNDLSRMEEGDVVYGLWLDRKGKIVADSFVLCRGEEEFLLVSYFCPEGVIQERLDSYLIMEDAELRGISDQGQGVSLFLGEGDEVSGVSRPEEGRYCLVDGLFTFWGRRNENKVLELVAVGDAGAEKLNELFDTFQAEQSEEISTEEVLVESIRGTVPQIGVGFGEKDLPQELGLESSAVSFRKGCYLGQEVMARLHAMGKVRKSLETLSIEGSDTELGEALPLDLFDESGKRQGQARAVAYPETGGIILAVINNGFSEGSLKAGETVFHLIRRGKKADE